jgi:hypothetical protein
MANSIGIGNRIGSSSGQSWRTFWASMISATVENAAPTNVVITFPSAKNLVAADLSVTINGVADTIVSASWTGAVWTVVLTSTVIYGDVIVLTFEKTGQTKAVTNNVAAEAEYTTLLGALTGAAPSLTIKRAQNAFIKYLKGNNSDARNTWAKLACIIPYGAGMPTAADALFWWNNVARSAVLSAHAPDYTAGEGFSGDVANAAYIDTTFNPSVDGGLLYTQNDASIYKYFYNRRITTSTATAGITTINSKGGIAPFYSANTGYFSINGGWKTFVSTNTDSAYCAVRKNATQIRLYVNNTEGSLVVDNSVALPNCNSYDLAANTGANVPDAPSFMPDTIGLTIYASGFDATDVKVINDALDLLLDNIQTKTVLMYDACDGATIDATKWEITNTDTTVATFEQNNALIMNSLTTNNANHYNNMIQSIYNQKWGVWKFSALIVLKTGLTGYSYLGLKDNKAAANFLTSYRVNFDESIAEAVGFKIDNGAVNVYTSAEAFEFFAQVKLIVTPTHSISCYVWQNDAWVQIGVTQNYIAMGLLYLFMGTRGVTPMKTSIRDVYVTKHDYSTLNPT